MPRPTVDIDAELAAIQEAALTATKRLGRKYQPAVKAYLRAARSTATSLAKGNISLERAEASAERLKLGLRQDLISAGYDAEAAAIDLVHIALGGLLKLAAAALL